jgi:hypothetical protein
VGVAAARWLTAAEAIALAVRLMVVAAIAVVGAATPLTAAEAIAAVGAEMPPAAVEAIAVEAVTAEAEVAHQVAVAGRHRLLLGQGAVAHSRQLSSPRCAT